VLLQKGDPVISCAAAVMITKADALLTTILAIVWYTATAFKTRAIVSREH